MNPHSVRSKSIVGLAVALATVVALSGVAAAQYNNPATVSASTPSQNADGSFTVTLSGTGFGPGTTVTFSYNPTLGTAVADAAGAVSFAATFPASLAGKSVTVTAAGVDASGNPVTTTTSLSFPGGGGSSSGGSSSGSGLAFTGSDNSSVVLRIGAIALVLGVALVLATRSRRNEHSSV
jgi:hypothetical protein